jgi:hypothetical protein
VDVGDGLGDPCDRERPASLPLPVVRCGCVGGIVELRVVEWRRCVAHACVDVWQEMAEHGASKGFVFQGLLDGGVDDGIEVWVLLEVLRLADGHTFGLRLVVVVAARFQELHW